VSSARAAEAPVQRSTAPSRIPMRAFGMAPDARRTRAVGRSAGRAWFAPARAAARAGQANHLHFTRRDTRGLMTQSLAGIRPDSSLSHGEATCLPAPRKGLPRGPTPPRLREWPKNGHSLSP
jgi:hypothetical protein